MSSESNKTKSSSPSSSSSAAVAPGKPPAASVPRLFRLLQAKEPRWGTVMQVLSDDSNDGGSSRDAHYVHPITGMTPLHYAATYRPKSIRPQHRRRLIKALLRANPAARTVRCAQHGCTPLAYACYAVVPDEDALREAASIVQLLLDFDDGDTVCGESTMDLLNSEGLTPLALHIRSISTFQFSAALTAMTRSKTATSLPSTACHSTALLEVLVAKSSRQHLERALETLYACNTTTIMNKLAEEEARAYRNIKRFGRQTRASPGAKDFWLWDWLMIILRGVHERLHHETPPGGGEGAGAGAAATIGAGEKKTSNVPPFHALHAMSQITDCPPPFVILAMRTYPSEMRVPDRAAGNLPLHSVASWRIPDNGSVCRKSMSLTSLVSEYPAAMDLPNADGKTPMDLEAESGSAV